MQIFFAIKYNYCGKITLFVVVGGLFSLLLQLFLTFQAEVQQDYNRCSHSYHGYVLCAFVAVEHASPYVGHKSQIYKKYSRHYCRFLKPSLHL